MGQACTKEVKTNGICHSPLSQSPLHEHSQPCSQGFSSGAMKSWRFLLFAFSFKKPAERICPICKIEMEDEYHFLNICPAYQEKRCSLLDYLEKEYRIKISRMSPNKIFMFLINPPSGNVKIQKMIAKHIFECFEKRKGEDGKATLGLN